MVMIHSCSGCHYNDDNSEYYKDYCIGCERNPNEQSTVDLYEEAK